MTTPLQEAESLLGVLSRAEKVQLLQSVINDLGDAFAGIESRPGVCGGEPCIVRTRIPVWVLEQARRLGTSEADLLRIYPTLRAEDIVHAWAYVRAHRTKSSDRFATTRMREPWRCCTPTKTFHCDLDLQTSGNRRLETPPTELGMPVLESEWQIAFQQHRRGTRRGEDRPAGGGEQ